MFFLVLVGLLGGVRMGHDRANYRTIKQRNLNNAFAYDLVPSPSVLTAALKAARRVNDFPTAVRIFEGMCFRILGTGGHGHMGINFRLRIGNWLTKVLR